MTESVLSGSLGQDNILVAAKLLLQPGDHSWVEGQEDGHTHLPFFLSVKGSGPHSSVPARETAVPVKEALLMLKNANGELSQPLSSNPSSLFGVKTCVQLQPGGVPGEEFWHTIGIVSFALTLQPEDELVPVFRACPCPSNPG